jgi:NAD(P)-dependent dehydrogenase (short-subunit alcohol dehydrogenase family)
MRVELDGKVAVVTGGIRNIGRAISLDLARSGATVAVTYATDEQSAKETISDIERLGGKAAAYQVDVREILGLRATFAEIARDLGLVSILVNNAAVRPAAKIGDIQIGDFDEVVSVNLRGPLFAAQAVLPGMRSAGWGRIVNISGTSAYIGGVQRAHVVATKLGIVGLSRALALECAGWGVTVNTVVPGWIGNGKDSAAHDVVLDRVPLDRRGIPEEVSAAVTYLCSPDAGYVTGQELLVNGGLWPLARQPWNEY